MNKEYFRLLTERYIQFKEYEYLSNNELEHISLTNQYLLLTIRKLYKGKIEGDFNHNFFIYEDIIYDTKFKWKMPEHHIPKGEVNRDIVIGIIEGQLEEVKNYLKENNYTSKLQSINVYGLGKTDYVGYCYFLLAHLERHMNNYLRRN